MSVWRSLSLFSCLMAAHAALMADTCPDPQNSSLQWGVPPSPWVVNPLSANRPQGEEGTRFVRANILVAGFGQGVTCTYQNSAGYYSILWQVPTHLPSRMDERWVSVLGGYQCSQGLQTCEFTVAQ